MVREPISASTSALRATRAMLVAYLSSSTNSGRPNTSRTSAAHPRSFWTPINTCPSRVGNASYGQIDAWDSPIRSTCLPAYIRVYMGWPIHSAVASNMDTSTVAPRPVRSRRKSAAWIADRAYIPVAMSDTGTPVLVADSGVPVIEHSPASACTSMS